MRWCGARVRGMCRSGWGWAMWLLMRMLCRLWRGSGVVKLTKGFLGRTTLHQDYGMREHVYTTRQAQSHTA